MPLSLQKLQAGQAFLHKELLFHPDACIEAKKLYLAYEEFLQKHNLSEYRAAKHEFWSLLKKVAPSDQQKFLNKKISKNLYYTGIDIKSNAIPAEKLKEFGSIEFNAIPTQQKNFFNKQHKKGGNGA